jgi:hypothetical protein
MKNIFPIFLIFVLVSSCCITKTDDYGKRFSGDGTSAAPYLIYNKADFMAICGGDDTINKYYRLEADLVDEDTITEPLGGENNGFYGFFDGNGHTINLNIQGNYKDAGLFSHIGTFIVNTGKRQYGTVKNLKLTGLIDVDGDDYVRAGSLAAVAAYPGSSISNIASSVKVIARGANSIAVGGITGVLNNVVVSHCYSTGDIIASNQDQTFFIFGGGIAGIGQESSIRYCWSSGSVLIGNNKKTYIGGILGGGAEILTNCVALNEKISGSPVDGMSFGTHRITTRIFLEPDTILANNYANNSMIIDNGLNWGSDVELHDSDSVGDDKIHGASVSLDEVESSNGMWWKTTAGWLDYFGNNENAPWKWDNVIKRPVLWFE